MVRLGGKAEKCEAFFRGYECVFSMAFQGDAIFWVEVEKIVPNPFQPRREFSEDKLKELSESIRMYGILQPLTVTRKEIQTEDGAFFTQYELIAGERRLRASKLAGMEQVPVIIRMGENSEQEKLELAIIENLQREDLNAVDRALAFRQLADVFELSHAAVARKVGRSREYVSNTIRLLGLPDYMLSSLRTADISEGHARTLLMLNDKPEEQDVIFREILLKKLSVREVERIVRKIASDKVRKKNWANTDAVLIEIEREFTDTLGTRVQILKTDFGGKLTIDYFSDEDLQKLLMIMKSQGKITDFHLAGSEEQGGGTHIQELEKITGATALEMVAPEDESIIQEVTLADVMQDEQAISHELEEVVAEDAQFAGKYEPGQFSVGDNPQRHSLDTNEVYTNYQEGMETKVQMEVREEMKVPASSYVAYERPVATEDTYVPYGAAPAVPVVELHVENILKDTLSQNYTTYPSVPHPTVQPSPSEDTHFSSNAIQEELKANMAKLNAQAQEPQEEELVEALVPQLYASDDVQTYTAPLVPVKNVAPALELQSTPQVTSKKDSDDDLYSMKNFSL